MSLRAANVFVNPNVDMSYIEKIVVLPFENHTKTMLVEERVRDIVSTEVLSRGLFQSLKKETSSDFFEKKLLQGSITVSTLRLLNA